MRVRNIDNVHTRTLIGVVVCHSLLLLNYSHNTKCLWDNIVSNTYIIKSITIITNMYICVCILCTSDSLIVTRCKCTHINVTYKLHTFTHEIQNNLTASNEWRVVSRNRMYTKITHRCWDVWVMRRRPSEATEHPQYTHHEYSARPENTPPTKLTHPNAVIIHPIKSFE